MSSRQLDNSPQRWIRRKQQFPHLASSLLFTFSLCGDEGKPPLPPYFFASIAFFECNPLRDDTVNTTFSIPNVSHRPLRCLTMLEPHLALTDFAVVHIGAPAALALVNVRTRRREAVISVPSAATTPLGYRPEEGPGSAEPASLEHLLALPAYHRRFVAAFDRRQPTKAFYSDAKTEKRKVFFAPVVKPQENELPYRLAIFDLVQNGTQLRVVAELTTPGLVIQLSVGSCGRVFIVETCAGLQLYTGEGILLVNRPDFFPIATHTTVSTGAGRSVASFFGSMKRLLLLSAAPNGVSCVGGESVATHRHDAATQLLNRRYVICTDIDSSVVLLNLDKCLNDRMPFDLEMAASQSFPLRRDFGHRLVAVHGHRYGWGSYIVLTNANELFVIP